jgi:hypothetical protein
MNTKHWYNPQPFLSPVLVAFTDLDGNERIGVIPYDIEEDQYDFEAYHEIL